MLANRPLNFHEIWRWSPGWLWLISNGMTQLTNSKFRDIGIAYCRMLLHDTMLKKDSHRIQALLTLRYVNVDNQMNQLNIFAVLWEVC